MPLLFRNLTFSSFCRILYIDRKILSVRSVRKLNRLRLDWGLESKEERLNFVRDYLHSLYFTPNEEELDTLSKYILWGKDPQTGLNGRQEGLQLSTRFKTWDQDENFESLEALLESPTFSEQIFRKPSDPIIRIPKLKLDRAQIRANAPASLLSEFEDLWRRIDTLELLCAYYDLSHGRRKAEIRNSLRSRFTESELASIREDSSHLNVYAYLRKRHELIDLRRLQYTLKDSYAPQIYARPTWDTSDPPDLLWGEDIDIYPLNVISLPSSLISRILRQDRFSEPSDYSESELSLLSTALWTRAQPTPAYAIDFSSINFLDKFCAMYLDLEDFCAEDPSSTLSLLFHYFQTYTALAPLKDFQRRILDLKLHRHSNIEIQRILREDFKKSYTLNYISTLYHQTILPLISETVLRHREVLENLFFPENFKTCIDCGRTLLRDSYNFMKKSKVKDGFSPRCKQCEKILRDRRKQTNK